MVIEEIKAEFKEHLGEEWEIWASEKSHERVGIQVKCKDIQFQLVFHPKKRYSAIQLIIRLSRVCQDYGIKCNWVINAEDLL